jgi:hypothetical protein
VEPALNVRRRRDKPKYTWRFIGGSRCGLDWKKKKEKKSKKVVVCCGCCSLKFFFEKLEIARMRGVFLKIV